MQKNDAVQLGSATDYKSLGASTEHWTLNSTAIKLNNLKLRT